MFIGVFYQNNTINTNFISRKGNIAIPAKNSIVIHARKKESSGCKKTGYHKLDQLPEPSSARIVRQSGGVSAYRQELAENMHEDAVELARIIGNPRGESSALINLASLYKKAGKLKESSKKVLSALAICRQFGFRDTESACLINTGNIYMHSARVKDAVSYMCAALSIKIKLGDRKGQAQCLKNIAIFEGGLNDHEACREHFLETVKIRSELNDHKGRADCLIAAAENELNRSRMHDAEALIGEAETVNPLIPDGNIRDNNAALMAALRKKIRGD